MAFRARMALLCAATFSAAAQSGTSALERHVAQAQDAQARQDCKTAAQEYTAAVKLLPSSGELRANQGIALYCNNQYGEATAALQKSLQIKPTLAAPHLFLGLAALHLSDEAAAVKELLVATTAMPGDITANLWLGYAYLAEHRSADAVHQFEEVLKSQPQNVDASYALGETYFEVGRRKALELEAVAPEGRGIRELAAHQRMLMATTDAGSVAAPKERWANSREEQLYNEALESETKARAALQTVLDEAPGSDRAHQIQGDAYTLQRNNDSAISEYEAVLTKNPQLPGVRMALANCLMQVNRFKDALTVLTEEQALQPRSADVWASIGRVQQALGNDADALASLKKAVALPNTPPAARLLLGKALLRLDDPKGAIPQLEQALREGADPSTTNYLLARAYRATGDRAAMQTALDAYHQNSRDQAERQAAAAVTRDPKAVPTEMTAQEQQEASAMTDKQN